MENNRNEEMRDQQNQVLISSNTNILSEINSDELHSLLVEKQKIKNELESLREKIITLEKRKTVIEIEIQKISVAKIRQDLSDDNIDEIDKETAVVGVIPKPLTIRGYDNIKEVLCDHIHTLIGSTSYSTPYRWYDDKVKAIAVALFFIGKELLFIKVNKNEKNEWRTIIDTCDKMSSYKRNGDMQGYQKYLDFFLQKYPLPSVPSDTFSSPDLFLKNESIYEDAFLLINYISTFITQIKGEYENNKGYFWPNYPQHVIFDKFEINKVLVEYMQMLYMLRKDGFTLAIVPIFDDNILYRPKRIAQSEKIHSLYYYDDYVEEPHMVGADETQSSSTTPYYSLSGGSTFVSRHYRSGHWRNGHYVRGGYVKGHFRRY